MDAAKFVSNWHIDAIAEHLEAVTFGYIRNLIINMPPRHMKSLSVSVAWPCWVWAQQPVDGQPLRGPGVQWLKTAYAQSLSVRDNVKCRRLIDSPWYQANWGDRFSLTSDQNTKTRFDNDKMGYSLATSVDGTATGEGGSIVTVDDPIGAKDANSETTREGVITWWDETMSSRLNDPKTGAYVITMQRLHEKDLTGHILGREHDYTVLCLPARYEPDHKYVFMGDPRTKAGELLWPERMDEEAVRKLEVNLGSYGAAGQLQQRPAPREGGMFKKAWFEIVRAAPAGLRKVRSWDLASTEKLATNDPDWTVGTLISKDDSTGVYYIEHVERLQGSPLKVETTITNTASRDGRSVQIRIPEDPGSAGKFAGRQLITKLAGYNARAVRETGSKVDRADPFSAQAEAGNVKLVQGDWNEAWLDELCSFPNASHDDQVDSATGGFEALTGSGGVSEGDIEGR